MPHRTFLTFIFPSILAMVLFITLPIFFAFLAAFWLIERAREVLRSGFASHEELTLVEVKLADMFDAPRAGPRQWRPKERRIPK